MRAFNLTLVALCVSGCLTNVPEPDIGGVYACVTQEDCPGSQSCLQQTCETITLPIIKILSPEDGQAFPFGEPHELVLSISATDLVLRPRAESNEAVPGEGHLVVWIDEVEAATIDSGDLSGGVQMAIQVADVAGAHRIRVQARLNDGTNYDNEDALVRNIIWVDDGREHVALRKPWPGDTFTLDSQTIDAEVAIMDDSTIEIGPPNTGVQHVHVFYDESFPSCLDDPLCFAAYEGIVPSNEDSFGPVLLPASGAGKVKLTAFVMVSDHTLYTYPDPLFVPDPEMPDAPVPNIPIFSEIEILRSND
jgi:hypothetical protein